MDYKPDTSNPAETNRLTDDVIQLVWVTCYFFFDRTDVLHFDSFRTVSPPY